MMKENISCLKDVLEAKEDNRNPMNHDVKPVWEDINGQMVAICRLKDDISEMEQTITAMEKDGAVCFLYRAGRTLRRLRQWASTQSLLMRVRYRILSIELHIWASDLRNRYFMPRRGDIKLSMEISDGEERRNEA